MPEQIIALCQRDKRRYTVVVNTARDYVSDIVPKHEVIAESRAMATDNTNISELVSEFDPDFITADHVGREAWIYPDGSWTIPALDEVEE